ncbi:putative leucine-rich repeat domain superfamily [Helianthus annuus]|uniref:Leucine-rich repeat domain superfamily n=1 Tax=Helianthus annuus TaxID=4232 RepID=A0A9K3I139_HELAN|nr:putative leucine-rich repeat domain superfamily [Helianthus annuus]
MLDWGQMSILGKLLGLEVLKLGDNAFVGERWVTPVGGFVQLSVLQIGKTNLVHWEAVAHQFPLLRRVSMKYCEQLVAIP